MIRKINADFVPVSVTAARMHQPPGDEETRLLHLAGQAAPAPQGMAVLNEDGRPLAWVLTYDSDEAVLRFLDHAKRRFQAEAARPREVERFHRYPSAPLPEAALPALPAPPGRHPEGAGCPGSPAPAPGTLVVQVIGRALDKEGRLSADTVHQSQYAQDRFEVPVPLQEGLASAVERSPGSRVRLPGALSRALVSHAYLGQLDVKPLDNPTGAPSRVGELDLRVEPVPGQAGTRLLRLEGRSNVETGGTGRPGIPPFEHAIRLQWRGFVEMDARRIRRLVLAAEGTERLRWQAPEPAGPTVEVALLPAGRTIEFDGKVRYGLIGGGSVR